ncbi:disintegrin and metalloproteinase domain-containing protein 12-like [Cetorhinus maximus]
MFASNVCLVFLIWCQVLNLSAAANEETPADDVITLRSGTLLTGPSNRPADHSPVADWETEIKGAASSGQGTASGFQSHQKKLLEELKDYKFVFSHVVSGKEKRSVAKPPQSSYPNHISISVQLEGKDLTLDLSRNNLLLPRGFQVSHYDPNGTLVTEKETELYRCCYEGSVRKFPGSQVSASICSGLSALIVFVNRTYIIEHLEGDKHGRYLLYRPEDLPPGSSTCGVKNTSPEFTLTDHLQRSQRVKRDVLKEQRYIELVLVGDNAMYQNLGRNKDAVVKRLLNIANTMDLYYRPFNIRVALIGVEVWTRDQIAVDRSASITLHRFLKWRQTNLLPRMHNDNAQLITGITFSKGVAGLAIMSVMCSEQDSGGVNSDDRPSHLAASATVSHEMGHNLGMAHDTDSRQCNCPDQQGCIMEEALGFVLPTTFSRCSRQDLVNSVRYGGAVCLSNVPTLDKSFGGMECGNQYVERGEQCDCGKPAECSDPCCEPLTCKLKSGARCSSIGACCKNCQLLPEGTFCRPLSGECDLPEFCTGISSDCPQNMYLKDGHTCNNGTLYCSRGICQSVDKQCEEIWGANSRSAVDICYKVANDVGNEFGHCGKDQNGQYIKCLPQDILCGKIQCKGGGNYPMRGGQLNVLSTDVTIHGVTYNCRGTASDISDASTPDLVQQGTKCGDKKVCYDAKCVDASVFKVQECDNNCNKKGMCNNNDNCHCNDGWAPPYCNTKGSGGSIDELLIHPEKGYTV